MPVLTGMIGRASELTRIRERLDAARDYGATGIAILGEAGIGKTALLAAAAADAEKHGWLVVSVLCHSMRQSRPFGVLRDIVTTLVKRLGADATTYTNGLDSALDSLDSLSPEMFETLLSRLLAGVLADRQVVIAIDDYQWIDAESSSALGYVFRVFSHTALATICSRRNDEVRENIAPGNEVIVLRALDPVDANDLAATVFPDAKAEILTAVVECGKGFPLDVIALATQARQSGATTRNAVLGTHKAVVASQLAGADLQQLEFLRHCSLIREPIAIDMLSPLYAGATVLADLIEKSIGRYLETDGSALRFVHTRTAEAVRETIKLPLEYHRRILRILLARENPEIADCEHIIDHARQCGDRELVRQFSLKLGDLAYIAALWRPAIDAYREAFLIRHPAPEDGYETYRRYISAMRFLDHDVEAEHALRGLIAHCKSQGAKSLVARLAAVLVNVLADLEEFEQATQTFRLYFEDAPDGVSRSELLGAAAAVYAGQSDVDGFEATMRALEHCDTPQTNLLGRFKLSEAKIAAHLGDRTKVAAALDAVRVYARGEGSYLEYFHTLSGLLVEHVLNGPEWLSEKLRTMRSGTEGSLFGVYLANYADFCTGEWDAALTRLADVNLERQSPFNLAMHLSLPAAISALTHTRTQYEPLIMETLSTTIRERYKPSITQLGVWWAITKLMHGETVDAALQRYLKDAYARSAPALGVMTFSFAFSIYASLIGEREILQWIADESPTPKALWPQILHNFARAHAAFALDRSTAAAMLNESIELLRGVGTPVFATVASIYARSPSAHDIKLAGDLGLVIPGASPVAMTAKRRGSTKVTPSARELQVANLVAEGMTNRQIAGELFLSERTVEVHIANLFTKLHLNSRVQLAGWIIAGAQASA